MKLVASPATTIDAVFAVEASLLRPASIDLMLFRAFPFISTPRTVTSSSAIMVYSSALLGTQHASSSHEA